VPAHRTVFAIFCSVVMLALGCTGQSPPNPSDPAAGKELLEKALDAWKRGESHEAYKQSTPSITVIEHAWKSGAKLIDFEIAGDYESAGYDVRFKVTLNLIDKGGSPKKQKALYNVCTTPALVVKRAEGSW
jgi:hypothetical protein